MQKPFTQKNILLNSSFNLRHFIKRSNPNFGKLLFLYLPKFTRISIPIVVDLEHKLAGF